MRPLWPVLEHEKVLEKWAGALGKAYRWNPELIGGFRGVGSGDQPISAGCHSAFVSVGWHGFFFPLFVDSSLLHRHRRLKSSILLCHKLIMTSCRRRLWLGHVAYTCSGPSIILAFLSSEAHIASFLIPQVLFLHYCGSADVILLQ